MTKRQDRTEEPFHGAGGSEHQAVPLPGARPAGEADAGYPAEEKIKAAGAIHYTAGNPAARADARMKGNK